MGVPFNPRAAEKRPPAQQRGQVDVRRRAQLVQCRNDRITMTVAIVGGGICGLSLALNLHARGIACRVYEAAPEVKELGVGITLLPHAMREMSALGLGDELLRAGIENAESCFFNRFGQLIYKEPRGKAAGYQFPEVGIHRGRLHMILYKAALARLGAEAIPNDHESPGAAKNSGS